MRRSAASVSSRAETSPLCTRLASPATVSLRKSMVMGRQYARMLGLRSASDHRVAPCRHDRRPGGVGATSDAALSATQRDSSAPWPQGLSAEQEPAISWPTSRRTRLTSRLRAAAGPTAGIARSPLRPSDPHSRAGHTHGKAFRDVVRNLEGRLDHPPDFVARPTTEAEIVELLDWCAGHDVAAIPYGGGSSVVGGVEPDVGEGYPARSPSTSRPWTGCSRSTTGVGPPASKAARSGRCWKSNSGRTASRCATSRSRSSVSTLGGWIATRAGGHFATVYTHIDDLVESVRVVTPSGHRGVAAAPRIGRRTRA